MNQDIFKGKWKQVRGEIKKQWGKLTDDDLRQVDGSMDKMIGKLQERYGYTRDDAERNLNRHLDQMDKPVR